ncbi:MAG: D-alanyl-D-alanine carboxypeptidase family protein [Xanthobacteraceae bacterium]
MRLGRIALRHVSSSCHLSVRHVSVWQRVAAVGLLASLLVAPLTFDAAQARPAKKNAEASAGQDASTPKKRSARVGKTRSRAAGGWNRPNYAAIVVDDKTGQVLHEANADAPRHPASMTKVMTLYLLFEQLEAGHLQLDSELPVSARAAARPKTKLFLKAGQTIKVEDAIKGLVTRSANDAATAIAEALGGTEEDFGRLMTRKAIALGMSGTIYVNASGLPADLQITTARDQALLGRAIQHRFPNYFGYFATKSFTYRKKEIGNHNALLGNVEGVDGIKTGYTNASGYNLLCSVKRDGREIVAVVLGGRSGGARDARMRQLIDEYLPSAGTDRTAPVLTERGPDGEPVTSAIAPELPSGLRLASDDTVDAILLTNQIPGNSTLRTDVADYEREDAPPGSKEDQERKAKKAEMLEKAAKPVKGAKAKAAKEKAATSTKDQPRRSRRPAGNAATQTVPAGTLAQRQQQPAFMHGRD